ncbi:MAG: zinc ribbon domain-containing protein [Burkholderiales bacterium]
MKRHDASAFGRHAPAGFAAHLAILVMALFVVPAFALAQTAAAPKGNPRLASLNIEVWPEYDRPSALVILRGVLAESVKLPAKITMRLPGSAGGPLAVAYSATADGSLLNLQHELAVAGEYATLKFEVPQRFFHVEFYEPIATTNPARTYRYVWPGDLAVDRVGVTVQEPATATDIAVEPNLDRNTTGQEGLGYRSADLGAMDAGKPLPISVRYTKTDARPSAEILKLKASAPAPAAPPAIAPAPAAAAASGGLPEWALPLAGFVLLSLLGAAVVFWQWRRNAKAAVPAGRFCAKCGAAQVPGNRFCSNCGAKVG